MNRKTLLITLTLFSLLIPNVLAITFDGIDFVSSTGGVVKFGSSFVASRFSWVNGLNSFNGLRWAGANRGILGFDCTANVNMTITGITRNTITYTIETGVGPAVNSFVYYRRNIGMSQLTRPVNVIGGTWTYNDGLGILTVATTGSPVLVTIVYGMDAANPLIGASNLIWALMPFLALVIGVDDVRKEEFGTGTLMKIVLTGTIIAFFAWLFRTWGF